MRLWRSCACVFFGALRRGEERRGRWSLPRPGRGLSPLHPAWIFCGWGLVEPVVVDGAGDGLALQEGIEIFLKPDGMALQIGVQTCIVRRN